MSHSSLLSLLSHLLLLLTTTTHTDYTSHITHHLTTHTTLLILLTPLHVNEADIYCREGEDEEDEEDEGEVDDELEEDSNEVSASDFMEESNSFTLTQVFPSSLLPFPSPPPNSSPAPISINTRLLPNSSPQCLELFACNLVHGRLGGMFSSTFSTFLSFSLCRFASPLPIRTPNEPSGGIAQLLLPFFFAFSSSSSSSSSSFFVYCT